MFSSIDIWEVLAGIAIFMLGSSFMDESLRSLVSRRFKLFLKRQTARKFHAVSGGFIFSGLLQSSSVVNLLVLSLAGAGVIQLVNALAVVLGSNLGSTATNWLVASIGFSFEIETMAFPLAGITGIGITFITAGTRFYYWCRLLLGFSFLFIGLGFIKSGVSELIRHIDLGAMDQYPMIIFMLAGLFITAIIQSSSATTALILSGLHVHAISLPAAMAVLLGSETGTTLKLFLASVKGNPVKKRIAFGNLLFNIGPAALFLLLLLPSHDFITKVIRIENNLIALVFFQTMVNLGCIIIFYPFLKQFARWLSGKFSTKKQTLLAIHNNANGSVQLSTDALEQDIDTFARLVLRFCKSAVHIKEPASDHSVENIFGKSLADNYTLLKNLYGELHGYYIRIAKDDWPVRQKERLERLTSGIRNGLYAAKSIKDAVKDIEQLYNSANDAKFHFYLKAREKIGSFCDRALTILDGKSSEAQLAISILYKEVQQSYDNSLRELYSARLATQLNEQEISTLVNFNRETYTAFKSVLFALKDYLLEGKAAEDFNKLPGFIH